MMGMFDGLGDSFGSLLGGALGGLGSIAGGAISATNSSKVAQMNIQAQKEFAQNGIRWRVEDAKAAKVHPLFALGATTSSFSPIQGYQGDYGIGEALGQFGQGISRAAQAKMTKEEREQAQAQQEMKDVFQLAQMNKQNQYMDAQIDLINSEVARNKVASYVALMGVNKVPAMPTIGKGGVIDGQGDSDIEVVPDKVTASGSSKSTTAGTHPLWVYTRNGDFTLPVISPDLSDAVTENKEKHVGSEVGYAIAAWNGAIKPPYSSFTKSERVHLASGKYKAYYIPLVGWTVQPRLSWSEFVKFITGGYRHSRYSADKRTYSGALDY